MITRLLTIWHSVSTGLWFVPTALVVAGAALAWVMLGIDLGLDPETTVWWLHSGSAADASDLLETLLSSMITMTTLAVSITMVVLTLAAGQLGPRLIPSFIDDRRTQIPLGFLPASIVYLLLVLRMLNERMSDDAVPHAAVTLGTLLVLISIGMLLFFVHHLSRSIVSDRIVARVGGELDRAIDRMLDDPGLEAVPATGHRPFPRGGSPIAIDRAGYIQAIDHPRLVRWAREHDARIELCCNAGHHVLSGCIVGRIFPDAAAEGAAAAVAEALVIGGERTPVQDLAYSMRQLVEIALRALSPGINDPNTGIAVIDRVAASLARVMQRAPARSVWQDDEGFDRLILPTYSFADLLDVALNQIRQAASHDAAILIRMAGVLRDLGEVARTEAQRDALRRHTELVLAAGRRGLAEPADRADLEAAARGRRWPTEGHPAPES